MKEKAIDKGLIKVSEALSVLGEFAKLEAESND